MLLENIYQTFLSTQKMIKNMTKQFDFNLNNIGQNYTFIFWAFYAHWKIVILK